MCVLLFLGPAFTPPLQVVHKYAAALYLEEVAASEVEEEDLLRLLHESSFRDSQEPEQWLPRR